jgi:hypothetical protein
MSLQSKIKRVARELAMEEMHKRGGRVGLAYHGLGEGLDDSYGLTEVGGRMHHRRRSMSRGRGEAMRHRSASRHRSTSRGRAGLMAYGMRHRSSSRHRSMSRGRGEAMRHRSSSRHRSMSRGRGEAMRHRSSSRHRSMSRGRGEAMRHHMRRRSHSRGRGEGLDDTYGLPVTGGLVAYGMRKRKSTRAPSAYNLFVKKYLLANPMHTIREAAAAWREHK